LDRKGGVEVVERTTESASVAAEEGLASYEGVTRVRVKPRVETLAPRSLARRREERTRPGVLTRVARPFGAPSIGFPGENLLEPNAGAVGRTSAADPFKYVLRCCGPQRAGDLVLRAEVERTGERNAESRIVLGVSAEWH